MLSGRGNEHTSEHTEHTLTIRLTVNRAAPERRFNEAVR